MRPQDWVPSYSRWRHGGWYVDNLRYPTGAIGCVSRNFRDRKWRIVCDPRPFAEQPTYPDRDAAARAEQVLVDHEWALIEAREREVRGPVCRQLDCLAPLERVTDQSDVRLVNDPGSRWWDHPQLPGLPSRYGHLVGHTSSLCLPDQTPRPHHWRPARGAA